MTDIASNLPRVIRLRIINIETASSRLADITAIGLAEMEIYGTQAAICATRDNPFTHSRPCTDDALTTAATRPGPVDAYVTYDLSRTRELMPAHATGFASWIGIGRLLVQLGHEVVGKSAEAVARDLGFGLEIDVAQTNDTTASRNAVATALLLVWLYEQMEDLNRMLRFSRAKTRPLQPIPSFTDAAGWEAMSRDDLGWMVDHQAARALAGLAPDPAFDDAVTHRAMRELNHRRIFTHRT